MRQSVKCLNNNSMEGRDCQSISVQDCREILKKLRSLNNSKLFLVCLNWEQVLLLLQIMTEFAILVCECGKYAAEEK